MLRINYTIKWCCCSFYSKCFIILRIHKKWLHNSVPFFSMKSYKSVPFHIRYFSIQSDKRIKNISPYAWKGETKNDFSVAGVWKLNSFDDIEINSYSDMWINLVKLNDCSRVVLCGIINLCVMLQMHKSDWVVS